MKISWSIEGNKKNSHVFVFVRKKSVFYNKLKKQQSLQLINNKIN